MCFLAQRKGFLDHFRNCQNMQNSFLEVELITLKAPMTPSLFEVKNPSAPPKFFVPFLRIMVKVRLSNDNFIA